MYKELYEKAKELIKHLYKWLSNGKSMNYHQWYTKKVEIESELSRLESEVKEQQCHAIYEKVKEANTPDKRTFEQAELDKPNPVFQKLKDKGLIDDSYVAMDKVNEICDKAEFDKPEMTAKEFLYSKYPLVKPEWFDDNEMAQEMIKMMKEYREYSAQSNLREILIQFLSENTEIILPKNKDCIDIVDKYLKR